MKCSFTPYQHLGHHSRPRPPSLPPFPSTSHLCSLHSCRVFTAVSPAHFQPDGGGGGARRARVHCMYALLESRTRLLLYFMEQPTLSFLPKSNSSVAYSPGSNAAAPRSHLSFVRKTIQMPACRLSRRRRPRRLPSSIWHCWGGAADGDRHTRGSTLRCPHAHAGCGRRGRD